MSSIQGSTALYLLPGDPVTNVRLPRMFNAVFARYGIDAVMVPVQVPVRDIALFMRGAFLGANVRGMAIAPPHKPRVLDLLDRYSIVGRAARSVNAVRRTDNGQLEGDLFDGEGFTAALEHFGIAWRDRRVLVLGAGVSAAAIGLALADGGAGDRAARIAFYDPTAGKAAGLAAQLDSFFDAEAVPVDTPDPAGYDLVVNATPLGLEPGDAAACDVSRMEPHAAVFDILLRGQPTPLVQAARARGLQAQPGYEMLVAQMPYYLDYFGHAEAAQGVREDADYLRRIVYPTALHGEIRTPRGPAAGAA